MDLLGQKIGQIRIEALIGRGGMGLVYRGFDDKLKRHVAIKVLRQDQGFHREARARFIREARILSRLDHPGICKVYDLVDHAGVELLVLELVEGKTLRQLIKTGTLAPAEKLRVAAAVAEVIAVAHGEQIIHRDLKPENILLTPKGEVKILDFGIARSLGQGLESSRAEPEISTLDCDTLPAPEAPATRADPDLDATELALPETTAPTAAIAPRQLDESLFVTQGETTLGTITYMSPEQARREPVTAASDQYSLGILFQELFTGRRAYPELPLDKLLTKVRIGDTLPVEGVDPELGRLIEQLKDPRPSHRPSAATSCERLRWLIAAPERRRRLRFRLAGLAAVALLLLSAFGAVVASRFEARRQAQLAQDLAREASEIEWLLRAGHLAPIHDLRAEKTEAQQRMRQLEQRVAELPTAARAPGEAALGRAALALGDFETARRRLEAAWKAGLQAPEVAGGLGLASFERYREELSRLRRSAEGARLERALAALNRELRDPAVAFLEQARAELAATAASSARAPRLEARSIEYYDALIAFYQERYDEALAKAEAAAGKNPWLYEAQRLIGNVHFARGEIADARNDYPAAAEALARSRAAHERAAEIGRSDPANYFAGCEVAIAQMRVALYGAQGPVQPHFDTGRSACETGLAIDPDAATGWRFLADLFMRLAEAEDDAGRMRALLRESRERAEAALRRDGDDPRIWKTLGDVAAVEADYELYFAQGERGLIERAIEAYTKAAHGAPDDPNVINRVGNAYSLLGRWLDVEGHDPRAALAASVEAYRRALELDPEQRYIAINLGQSHLALSGTSLERGGDPAPDLERAEAAFEHTLADGLETAGGRSGLAQHWMLAARQRLLWGGDPAPLVAAALAQAERALALPEGNFYFVRSAAARAELLAAELELRAGRDPQPALERASRLAKLVSDPLPNFLETRETAVAVEQLRAESRIERGVLGAAVLAPARGALASLQTLIPDRPGTWLAEAELELLEGRRLARLGRDPEPAFGRAQSLLERYVERQPERIAGPLRRAQLERWRAEAIAARGGDPRPTIAHGRELVRTLLARFPGLPEGAALLGIFEGLEAGRLPPGEDRRQLLASAAARLGAALERNANLDVVYHRDLERLRSRIVR